MIRRIVNKLLSPKYLIWTNLCSGAVLTVAADGLEQYREIIHKRKRNKVQQWNYRRSVNMFTMGAALGIPNHFWYLKLDRILPGVSASVVLRKILLDEAIASPVLIVTFLIGIGLLEGKAPLECQAMVKEKFLPLYAFDLVFWPAAQCINFFYFPPRARVVFVNSFTFLWDMFLSFIIYGYKPQEETEEEVAEKASGHTVAS